MSRIDFKKWTPHLLVIGIMLAVALLFAYPALQGQVLNQHDSISWKGMSQEARTYFDSTGKTPLWSNSQFGGMPTYTYYLPGSTTPFSIIYETLTSVLPEPANFFFLAMLSFYVLAHVMRVNRWLGLLGSLAFAFATYNPVIIAAGHNTKMFAIAFMPAVLAGLILLYRQKWLSGAALFGLAMAFVTATGHYQVVYYLGLLLLFVAVGYLVKAVKNGTLVSFLKSSALALLLGGIGVSTASVGLLPTREYNEYTMRGGKSQLTLNKEGGQARTAGGLDKEYAFRWSQGWGELLTVLVPDLYGGSSGEPADRLPETQALVGEQYKQLPGYWGPQPFVSGPVYFGAIICFLFVLGMIVVRHPMKWALAGAAALGFLLSLGKNFAGFNYFLFDYLPLLKNFRTPSMAMVIPQLVFPLMGVWGLHLLLLEPDREKRWKAVKLAAGIAGGLALLIGLIGPSMLDFTNPETDAQLPKELLSVIREDRAGLARNSGLLSAFYIVTAAGLLWAMVYEKLKASTTLIILCVLTYFDLQTAGKRYLGENNYQDPSDYEMAFQPNAADKQIMADPDPYFRVFDYTRNTYNDAVQSYFFKSVGGYSPAKMESYQDLIDVHLNPQKGMNSEVLNMLNTKYFIVPGQGGAGMVLPNSAALGNAWFVENVKFVNTANEEMLAMNAPVMGDTAQVAGGWNARATAIIRKNFESQVGTSSFARDASANIKLTQYGLNDIHFQSGNAHEGLAVFSDIYYDRGWKAFIDGKETPIIRANYVLRALRIPAGNHKIDFRFEPQTYQRGKTITLISGTALVILAALAVFYAVWDEKRKKTA